MINYYCHVCIFNGSTIVIANVYVGGLCQRNKKQGLFLDHPEVVVRSENGICILLWTQGTIDNVLQL